MALFHKKFPVKESREDLTRLEIQLKNPSFNNDQQQTLQVFCQASNMSGIRLSDQETESFLRAGITCSGGPQLVVVVFSKIVFGVSGQTFEPNSSCPNTNEGWRLKNQFLYWYVAAFRLQYLKEPLNFDKTKRFFQSKTNGQKSKFNTVCTLLIGVQYNDYGCYALYTFTIYIGLSQSHY